MALVLGGSLSASTLAGVLGGCAVDPAAMGTAPGILTADQFDLVTALAEQIIPATDTPGATAAQVPAYIDLMLTEWYPAADRERFLGGLANVEARAQAAHANSFVACTTDQQHALMTVMDNEVFRGSGAAPTGSGPPFFRVLKELVVAGYYTSEVGATQELRVMPMGIYRADVPYDEIGHAWA